jgi:hypothetical protein
LRLSDNILPDPIFLFTDAKYRQIFIPHARVHPGFMSLRGRYTYRYILFTFIHFLVARVAPFTSTPTSISFQSINHIHHNTPHHQVRSAVNVPSRPCNHISRASKSFQIRNNRDNALHSVTHKMYVTET